MGLALCLFLGSTVAYAQCMMEELPLNTVVDGSDEVFEGLVTSKSCYRDENGAIYTRYTIHVTETLGAERNEYVEVIAQGGVVDGYAQMVYPSLQLSIGDAGLFLCQSKQMGLQVTSVSQGFYTYEKGSERAYSIFGDEYTIRDLKERVADHKGDRFNTVSNVLTPEETVSTTARDIIITGVSPTDITAGTGQVLTITGQGFGSGQFIGQIAFKNANNGGAGYIQVPQGPHVLSWTDTEIKVTVPAATVYGQFVAGTGPIKVINAGGGEASSDQVVNVKYAKSEVYYNGNIDHTDLADVNGEGGYTIQFGQNIFENTEAMRSYAVALNNWKCNTGVNLKPDTFNFSDAGINYNDGVSFVQFDNSQSLGEGILGSTVVSYSACYFDGEMHWIMTDMDMSIKPNFNWYFGDGEVPSGQYDFNSVILHELGHSQLIQHNLNENSAMYFRLSSGQSKRFLDAASDQEATNHIINGSGHLEMGCSQGPMQVVGPEECDQSLTGIHNHYEEAISIYPNPTTGLFFIDGLSGLGSPRLQVYNAVGALVLEDYPTSERAQIDISHLPSGIYAVRILSGQELLRTEKLIVSGK